MPKQNIVKETCKELGTNQKGLADMLEVSPSSISDWVKGDIPKMTEFALTLLIENNQLKKKMKSIKEAYSVIREL